MKPRFLYYLRLHDEPPSGEFDRVRKLPITVENLRHWFEFCRDLANQRLWKFELLTIDFNFMYDTSGPWFPSVNQDPKVYNADFLSDPALRELKWSNGLENIGPNTGLLIGTVLVAHAAHRDLPCGIAFHTYHPTIVLKDMSSAMLAAQIVLATGAKISVQSLSETLGLVIEMIQPSFERPLLGLEDAVARFREGFLRRAGSGEPQSDESTRLWMETSSLWNLLDIFRSAETEEQLDQELQDSGIEFYDRNGILDSLDVRSVFLDRLIEPNGQAFRSYLPLTDVRPAGDLQPAPGFIWSFVEALAIRTPSNISPILDFFRRVKSGERVGTLNDEVKRKVHRLIALIFAWIDLYVERWFDSQSTSYDPSDDDFEIGFSPLTEQIKEILRIIDLASKENWQVAKKEFDPTLHFLPISGLRSISSLVRHYCVPGSPLHKALRCGVSDVSKKFTSGLENLLSIAETWGCVEQRQDNQGQGTGAYRLKRVQVPQRRPMKISQMDIAQHLGFNVDGRKDPSNQLARIIHDAPGFENVSIREFLSSLEERPLPDHLKWLGWEFIDQFWGRGSTRRLPHDALPLCLSEMKGSSAESISLLAWGQEVQRSHDAVVRSQSVIMPTSLGFRDEYCEIQCWRRTSEEVGGDYYRVKPAPEASYSIYIGDVCGKGLPAALTVQEIHGLVTMLDEQAANPEQVCTQLDRKLGERISGYGQVETTGREPSDRWATFVCLRLDLQSYLLTYANAGHPSPLLVRKNGDYQMLQSQSRVVGLVPGDLYYSQTIQLMPGDRLVLFTDGLTENAEDELLQFVQANIGLSAKDLNERLIRQMVPAGKLADDLTLIVVAIGQD